MKSIRRVMSAWVCMMVVGAYQNILLIGPRQKTLPFARHYARFYNATLLDTVCHLRPVRYVMVVDEHTKTNVDDEEEASVVRIHEYPRHYDDNSNLNYFISWLKQNYG